MRSILYMFSLCILAGAGYARYIPFPEGLYEYGEDKIWVGRMPTATYLHSRVKRWISPVHAGNPASYQLITDSVLTVDSTYGGGAGWTVDTISGSRIFQITLSDSTVDFDSLFAPPRSSISQIRYVEKTAFDSGASFRDPVSESLKIERGYFRMGAGDSIGCILITTGQVCCRNELNQNYSQAVFSERYGVKAFSAGYSDWGGLAWDSLELKRAVIGKDTIDFGNTAVVGIRNGEHARPFGPALLSSRRGPARVGLYGMDGKLLRSWAFGAGEEIKPGKAPGSAVLRIVVPP